MNYKVWTDGSSIQQRYGGWGFYIQDDTGRTWSSSGRVANATNAAAELYAIKKALEFSQFKKDDHIVLYTDSNYALGVLTKGHKINKNIEVISEIFSLLQDKIIVLEKIKRRSTKETRIVDALANVEAKATLIKPVPLEPEQSQTSDTGSTTFTFTVIEMKDQDGNTYYKYGDKSGTTPYEPIINFCTRKHIEWNP